VIKFWAVLIDETGCEFGAGVTAATRGDAMDQLREDYPESRVDQLESPEDTRLREARIRDRVRADYDYEQDY
tara:strand:+ start:4621 stop:4836 length:216 start_codon:yes stop_codon:yes gene_type:complete